MGSAFLANVGANASHRARSPLFPDRRFLLMPYPEPFPWRPPMVRLGDLPELAAHAPATWSQRAVHLDPDLDPHPHLDLDSGLGSDGAALPPTFGDNCSRAGRAFSLRQAAPGDSIHFLARLTPTSGGPAGFHLVGRLVINEILAEVREDPGPGWWEANAHVRRGRAYGIWDGFWVFRGGPGTRLLPRAVEFTPAVAESLFGPWRWPLHRTSLQVIGSHTRAVRRLTGAAARQLERLTDG